MGQPWGLSGPDFLALYAGVLAAWCAVVVLVRAEVRGFSFQPARYVPGLYERAFLNGGSDRVADTALAGLIEDGSIRATRSRQLHRIKADGADDAQRAVLSVLGRESGLAPLRTAFRRSGFCDAMRRRLIDEGLLVTPGVHTALRVLVWGFPLLALIAVVRGVNGLALGYPVGYLFLEFAATLIAWAFAAGACGHPLPTRAGDAARRGIEAEQPVVPPTGEHRRRRDPRTVERTRLSPGSMVWASAAERVAQGGLEFYPDPTVARLFRGSGSGGGAIGGGAAGGGGHGGGGGCGGGGGGGC